MVLRAQTGSVALFALLGLFLAGLLGGGYYIFFSNYRPETTVSSPRNAYDDAVSALERVMGDPRNFEASLERNSSAFACLYSANGDCQGKGGTFLLYDAGANNQPVSQLALDVGLNAQGLGCKGYPSEACPLRVETVWDPVCAEARCEGTRSVKVKAKITLFISGGGAPLEWTREDQFHPQIQLSQSASCERGGGVWANTECLTPAQASERQIASAPYGSQESTPPAPSPGMENIPPAQLPSQYECPAQIVVQGQYYPVQFLSADRGQVSVPAMSCQMEGYFDLFVFQCAAKSPGTDSTEGQWVQVEAVMAPACDQEGKQLGEGVRI